jgi:transposase
MTTGIRKGPASLRRPMPEILENADEKLSTRMRRLLDFLWQEWKGLQSQIESLNTDLEQIASSDASCVRLQQIPGVGPLVSTAVVSAIGNGAAFKKGREFAAWNVDERIGNQSSAQCRDRRHRQQAGQDQLGSFGERERISPKAQSTCCFQLDEVVS